MVAGVTMFETAGPSDSATITQNRRPKSIIANGWRG
jgi:hypothetical protein